MGEEPGELTRQMVQTLESRVNRLEAHIEKTLDEIWGELKGLRNRLPAWATFVISLLFFFLGACLANFFR